MIAKSAHRRIQEATQGTEVFVEDLRAAVPGILDALAPRRVLLVRTVPFAAVAFGLSAHAPQTWALHDHFGHVFAHGRILVGFAIPQFARPRQDGHGRRDSGSGAALV